MNFSMRSAGAAAVLFAAALCAQRATAQVPWPHGSGALPLPTEAIAPRVAMHAHGVDLWAGTCWEGFCDEQRCKGHCRRPGMCSCHGHPRVHQPGMGLADWIARLLCVFRWHPRHAAGTQNPLRPAPGVARDQATSPQIEVHRLPRLDEVGTTPEAEPTPVLLSPVEHETPPTPDAVDAGSPSAPPAAEPPVDPAPAEEVPDEPPPENALPPIDEAAEPEDDPETPPVNILPPVDDPAAPVAEVETPPEPVLEADAEDFFADDVEVDAAEATPPVAEDVAVDRSADSVDEKAVGSGNPVRTRRQPSRRNPLRPPTEDASASSDEQVPILPPANELPVVD